MQHTIKHALWLDMACMNNKYVITKQENNSYSTNFIDRNKTYVYYYLAIIRWIMTIYSEDPFHDMLL